MWWKIPLYILLGIVALIVLLLVIPVYFRLFYDEKMVVTMYVWGIPIRLSGHKKNKEKTTKETTESDKPKEKKQAPAWVDSLIREWGDDGAKAVTAFIRRLAELVSSGVNRLIKNIHVTRCRIAVFVCGSDAAQTAQQVGWYCSAIYPAITLIENKMTLRHRHVTVTPDFLKEKSYVKFDIRFHAMMITALILAISLYKQYKEAEEMIHPQEEKENGK